MEDGYGYIRQLFHQPTAHIFKECSLLFCKIILLGVIAGCEMAKDGFDLNSGAIDDSCSEQFDLAGHEAEAVHAGIELDVYRIFFYLQCTGDIDKSSERPEAEYFGLQFP